MHAFMEEDINLQLSAGTAQRLISGSFCRKGLVLIFKSVQNLSVSPAQKEGQSAVRRTHPEALSFLMSPLLVS